MNEGRLRFFNLVKAMREAQKDYFQTHSTKALGKAKELEREVDKMIYRGDMYLHTQQPVQKELFQ